MSESSEAIVFKDVVNFKIITTFAEKLLTIKRRALWEKSTI